MTKIFNPPISFDQYQSIVSSIFDASLDSKRWEIVLKKIAAITNAEIGSLRILNLATNDVKISYNHNKDLHFEEIYKDYYVKIDPWLHHYLNDDDTFITCTHHHLSNKEYSKLEFHDGIVEPQGSHYGMGGKIKINENITAYIALNRNIRKTGFEDEYFEFLLQLIPHIQKSLLINQKINNSELKQNLLSDALNKINSPLILVNKNGMILYINSMAENLIKLQPGISIKNNHILIFSCDDNNKLQKLIHQATLNKNHKLLKQGGAMNCTYSGIQDSMSILVSPVNPDITNIDTQSSENALLVLSTHSHSNPASEKLLIGLYNFTPAESRLSALLCQGHTLDEIASTLSLSKNTIRTQLRSSFNKTGVFRQSELINLINTGPSAIIKNS